MSLMFIWVFLLCARHALILLVGKPQVDISNGMDKGSHVAKFLGLCTGTG